MGGPVTPARTGREAGPGGPRTGWSPALEGLRALAVLAVLVHHVSYLSGLTNSLGRFGGLLARLDLGVALFFALSGFLLYRPFAVAAINCRPQPSVRRYLWHRALRILPAYWAMAAVALVWLNIDYLRSLWDWAVPLLLLQIYQPLRLPVGMEQTWSLATEVAFYLALPLFAVLGRKLGGRTPRARARRHLLLGVVLIVAGAVWNAYTHAPDSALPGLSVVWLPAYLDWFGLGMVLAVLACWPVGAAAATPFLSGFHPGTVHDDEDLWLTTPRGLRVFTFAPGTAWLVAGMLLWIASTPIAGPRALEPVTAVESLTEHLLFGLVVWFVMAPLVGPRPAGLPQALLSHPVVRFLGRISYGIFLWHLLAIEACLRLLGFTRFDSSFWGLLLASLLLTIPAATLSYYLIEWPLQRLRRRVESRPQAADVPEPVLPPPVEVGVPVRAPVLQGAASAPPGQAALPAGLVAAADPAVTQHQRGDGDEQQAGGDRPE
ncbi:acyltransferase [Micromonospora sp. NPDC126480]|uniref:acyltransferase family protein n=1 Tax=Micromonospora sp. NPDC126480 TaxID=3155312 RepID=UPI00332D33B6